MKIGIELQRVFRTRKHGMDIVSLNLVNELQQLDFENQYSLFINQDEDNQCIRKSQNFEQIVFPGFAYPIWEQIELPKKVKQHGLDMLHCTSNTAPISCHVPLILTLHDIIFMEMPLDKISGSWYQKFGNYYRRWVVPKVVEKAALIITVSEYERDRICGYFGLSHQKVQVVSNAKASHFKVIQDQALLLKTRKKYKLPEIFLFMLGNTDPKKNIGNVLKAYQQLLRFKKNCPPLVLADLALHNLKDEAKLHGISNQTIENIQLIGYVPNRELPNILNLAEMFLYPSKRESFGIPILEGMACGTPVVTSKVSAMPEIAGGAALLVDPESPEEMALGMLSILEDSAQKQALIQKGLKRADDFSWKKSAEKTLQLYQQLK